jgi:hypothetical protein
MTTPKPPAQPPKARKKKLQWIVFGVAGLFSLCCIGSFVMTRDDSHPSQPVGRDVTAAGKIGTAVRDGKFEFVVRSVQCGVDQIGPDYADERAQGQFCLVIVYDLPRGVELAQLELHASLTSAGVKIDLR